MYKKRIGASGQTGHPHIFIGVALIFMAEQRIKSSKTIEQ